MSHPFAHERDDGFGLVDVRVVTGIVQSHEGGVGIVRQQGLLVFVSDDLVLLAGDDEHRTRICAEHFLGIIGQPIALIQSFACRTVAQRHAGQDEPLVASPRVE